MGKIKDAVKKALDSKRHDLSDYPYIEMVYGNPHINFEEILVTVPFHKLCDDTGLSHQEAEEAIADLIDRGFIDVVAPDTYRPSNRWRDQ